MNDYYTALYITSNNFAVFHAVRIRKKEGKSNLLPTIKFHAQPIRLQKQQSNLHDTQNGLNRVLSCVRNFKLSLTLGPTC